MPINFRNARRGETLVTGKQLITAIAGERHLDVLPG